jgi:integrase
MMNKKELEYAATVGENPMKIWKDELRPSESYWRKCIQIMGWYTDLVEMDVEELIQEAEAEEHKNILSKKRKVNRKLTQFKTFLHDEYRYGREKKQLAPKSIHTYYCIVESFYLFNQIDLFKKYERIQRPQPQAKNTKQATMLHVRMVLSHCDLRDKAMLIGAVSSSLGASELSNTLLQTYIDGYDEVSNITAIRAIRQKLKERSREYVTFFSKEATQIIDTYLRLRKTPSPYASIEDRMSKLKQYPTPNGFLFVAQNIGYDYFADDTPTVKMLISGDIPAKYSKKAKMLYEYFEKGEIDEAFFIGCNEEKRRFTPHAIGQRFRKLSNNAGIDTEKDSFNIMRSHNMRKIFGNSLKMNKANDTIVEFWMGHKIKDTQNAYFISSTESISDESIDLMRKTYADYEVYLVVDKSKNILANPEYQKLVAENKYLQKDVRAVRVERYEFELAKMERDIELVNHKWAYQIALEQSAIEDAKDMIELIGDGTDIVYDGFEAVEVNADTYRQTIKSHEKQLKEFEQLRDKEIDLIMDKYNVRGAPRPKGTPEFKIDLDELRQ